MSKHWSLGRLQVVMKFHMKCSKPWIDKEFFGWLVYVNYCFGRASKERRIYVLSTSSMHTTTFLLKSFGGTAEYSVDGHLLLTVKSLYFCSEVCDRVARVKSQPFTVGVELRGYFLSLLLFRACMNWIDSHSLVNEGVAIGSYRINRLLLADGLLLLAPSEKSLQHALDRFSASCDRAGIQINSEMTKVPCLSRNPRQWKLHISVITLQQFENSSTLGCSHEWHKTEQGDWCVDWKSKLSCAWALSLCSHKMGAFKHCKVARF